MRAAMPTLWRGCGERLSQKYASSMQVTLRKYRLDGSGTLAIFIDYALKILIAFETTECLPL